MTVRVGAGGKRSVCLVAAGMVDTNLRLQPWRYLYEVANGLQREGHTVAVVSDGGQGISCDVLPEDVPVVRIPSVRNARWGQNRALQAAVCGCRPSVVVWHLGLTSLLHQRLDAGAGRPDVGVFTSPIYQWPDLARLGLRRLIQGYRLSPIHVGGAFVPLRILRRRFERCGLCGMVVQTGAVARQLTDSGLWQGRLEIIPPGVDEAWWCDSRGQAEKQRELLGYTDGDYVVAYLGSPSPLRGLPTLLGAFSRALQERPRLRLLVLSRRHHHELDHEARHVRELIRSDGLDQYARVVDGDLERSVLIRHVAAADLVALPFELVPSDAPLSLLEAQALGKPVLTTEVACLAELAANGRHYLAEPGDVASLSKALVQAAGDGPAASQRSRMVRERAEPRSWALVGRDWSRLVQSL
jgi:glycosyltransferase involved in cell wall biosynthesis